MKILKRILKIFMGLLVVLFVGITIFFLTFDLNSYKNIITTKASNALGRPVTIDSMSMKLSLIPTIEIKGVKIVNNDAFKDEPPLLEIDSINATLALLPLLKSKVEIKDFNMVTAKVTLVDKKGLNNFTLGATGATSSTAQNVQKKTKSSSQKDFFKSIANVLNRLSIDKVSVKTLLITHTKDDKKTTLAFMDVSIDQLKLVKMTVVYNGKMVKMELNLGDVIALMSRRPNYSFSAKLSAFDTNVELSGTIGNTVNFDNLLFNVSVDGKNLKKLIDNFVKINNIPEIPFGVKLIAKGDLSGQLKIQPMTIILGDNSVAVSADVTLFDIKEKLRVVTLADVQVTDAQLAAQYGVKPFTARIEASSNDKNITLNKLALSGGKSDVLMNGVVSLSAAVPMIKTQIVSRYFDLSDFMTYQDIEQKTQGNDASKVPTSLFSDKKIDFSALKNVNAQFAATAQYVKVPYLDNIGVAVSGDLKKGRLFIPSLNIRTMAGMVKGTVAMDVAQAPASIHVNIQSDALKLDAFKIISEQIKGVNVLTDLKLTTQGDSLKSFVSALNGKVVLEMTKGEIVNKWFNSLPVAMDVLQTKANAMNFSVSEKNTELICGAVNLNIKDGVIVSDNQIALETSVVDFSVSGQVDLPKEELSLTMVPSLGDAKSNVQEALDLIKIIKVSGAIAHPSFEVDTKTAVQSGLMALVNKVAEKQGVQLNSGQNIKAMQLCETVLNRSLNVQMEQPQPKKKKVVVKKVEPQEVKTPTDAKDIIKQQLLDSLSKALKK